jgi:hypothetical protein
MSGLDRDIQLIKVGAACNILSFYNGMGKEIMERQKAWQIQVELNGLATTEGSVL